MSSIRLTFASDFPIVVVLAVTVVAIASVWFFYKRVRGTVPARTYKWLVVIRIVAMAILLLALFRPVLSFQRSLFEKSLLLVLVDSSKSMSIRDFPNLPGRLERVQNALLSRHGLVGQVQDDFMVSFFQFGGDIERCESRGDLKRLKAEADATDLSAAAAGATATVEKADVAGVLIFTDGQHNGPTDAVKELASLGVPVYPVGVGSKLLEQKSFTDILISAVDSKRSVAVKNTAQINVLVEAVGLGDRMVPVILKQEGVEVAREQIVLDSRKGNQKVLLKFTPQELGQFAFSVEIPPDSSERIRENNVATFPMIVTDPKLKVLYIEGTLRWEYKFLKRTLELDPTVQVLCLVKTGQGAFYQQGNVEDIKLKDFPQQKKELEKFDVLIIGDLDRSHFSAEQMAMVKACVKQKMGLLMLGGYNSFGPGGYAGTPIEEVLPVAVGGRDAGQDKDEFLMKLTPEGMDHPIFAGCTDFFAGRRQEVPKLLGCVRVRAPKPSGRVLGVHPDRYGATGPLVVLAVQEFGDGRTAALTVDSTWKWYFQMRSLGQDSPYVKFWGQLMRWLAGRDQVEKSAQAGLTAFLDKAYYEPGETARIFARAQDDQGQSTNLAYITASIRGRRGKPRKLQLPPTPGAPGEYEIEFTPSGTGDYTVKMDATLDKAKLGHVELKFQVGKSNLEFDKLDLNDDLLRRIADASGGEYFGLISLDKLADKLRRTLREKRIYREIDFWGSGFLGIPPSAWVFLVFVGLVTSEWILRKQGHLA